MTHELLVLLTGLPYFLAIALGVWLGHSGRPRSAVLAVFHKLASLAAVVSSAFLFSDVFGGARYSPIALPLLGLGVVVLFATGAVMSGRNEPGRALLRLHVIPA